MTQKSKEGTKNRSSYVVGTLVASCIMLIRVVLITMVFAFVLVKTIIIPMSLMLAVLISFIIYYFIKAKQETKKTEEISVVQKLESPFQVLPAIKFAGLILIIKFLSAIGVAYKDAFDPQILYYALGMVS